MRLSAQKSRIAWLATFGLAVASAALSAEEPARRTAPPVQPALAPLHPPPHHSSRERVIEPPVTTIFQIPEPPSASAKSRQPRPQQSAPRPDTVKLHSTAITSDVQTAAFVREPTHDAPDESAEVAPVEIPTETTLNPSETSLEICPNCRQQHCRCDSQSRLQAFDVESNSPVAVASFDSPPSALLPSAGGEIASFVPWWQAEMTKALRPDAQLLAVTLDEMIFQAVQHSHFIRAQSNLPLMSEQAIIEAAAEFDVSAFTQSRFTRTSEPIGNTLTTGPGRSRFRDNNWTHNAGFAKKTTHGGSFELAQRYGYQQNNSDFLNPNPQSTTQLALRFSQPLLRGSGTVYNNSVIMLARIDKNIAWNQFSKELQDHLVDVSNAYWELYLQRAVLFQRQRHLNRAMRILSELETRGDIDTSRSQVVRAQAAVAARKSDLARARAAIRNAQVRLRALVNMPELTDRNVELVPGDRPHPQLIQVSLEDALVTALENRPEIDEAMQQLRSARVQVSVTQNELLPILDVVTETYVSGLQAGSSVGPAWVDQFSEGEPSYTFGLEMEVPLHNRAARARNRRKRLQLQWVVSRYQDTLANLTAEVEIVVRDVHTAYNEVCGKYHAMQATLAELDYLTSRWQLLPGDDRSASFLLEDILDIQDRLVGQEFEVARSQVAYTQSLVDLKRATGTLLDAEQVLTSRGCECGIPQLYLSKPLQYDEHDPYATAGDPLRSGEYLQLNETVPPVFDGPILAAPQPPDEALFDESSMVEPFSDEAVSPSGDLLTSPIQQRTLERLRPAE